MYIEGLSLSLPDSNLLEKQGIEMYDDPSGFSQDCVCACDMSSECINIHTQTFTHLPRSQHFHSSNCVEEFTPSAL